MRLTCSACGAHGSIELFTSDADARRAFDLATTKLPGGVGALVTRYIALFRPAKRALAWDRACNLLTELAAMVEAGGVERHGKRYPAAPDVFRNAMQQMLDQRERLDLPLKTHGYLVAIIVGESPRASAAAEQAAEEAKRQANAPRTGPTETDAERMARMRREAEEAERRELLRRQVADALKQGRT